MKGRLILLNIAKAVERLDENSCKLYQYYRWIAYECSTRQDTELEVDIYGTPVTTSNVLIREEYVESDIRQRVALEDGVCPLIGWDYRTSTPQYDKDGCSAYTFTDTSSDSIDGTLTWVYNTQYQNNYTCTTYNMSLEVATKLNDMQEY